MKGNLNYCLITFVLDQVHSTKEVQHGQRYTRLRPARSARRRNYYRERQNFENRVHNRCCHAVCTSEEIKEACWAVSMSEIQGQQWNCCLIHVNKFTRFVSSFHGQIVDVLVNCSFETCDLRFQCWILLLSTHKGIYRGGGGSLPTEFACRLD